MKHFVYWGSLNITKLKTK